MACGGLLSMSLPYPTVVGNARPRTFGLATCDFCGQFNLLPAATALPDCNRAPWLHLHAGLHAPSRFHKRVCRIERKLALACLQAAHGQYDARLC